MPLTSRELQELGRLVAKRHAALLEETREDVERSREESYAAVAGPVTDTADEAVADLLADLDVAEVERDLRTIRELEAARTRLADGSYGSCTDCGNDIGFERLCAYPTAQRCVECQRVHEKTHLYPGEPKL